LTDILYLYILDKHIGMTDIKFKILFSTYIFLYTNISGIGMAKSGLLNFLYGSGNCSAIWSTCRQHEIQHRELGVNKYTHNYPCVLA